MTKRPSDQTTVSSIKVSIAMATFNGVGYVVEQLESIAAQSRVPDEIVVVDDGSDDDTTAMIESWAADSALEVRLERNTERLGYAQNFSRALSVVTGDVVFPCDQDDRWDTAKIERMLAVLDKRPGEDVLICDAHLADVWLRRTGRTKLEQIRRAGMPESAFFMGCCMAIRKTFLDRVLPIPEGFPDHDRWIALLARGLGKLRVIEEPLQDYRLHGNNQSRHPANIVQPLGRIAYLRHRAQTSTTARLQASLKQRVADNQMLLDWACAQQEAEHVGDAEAAALQDFIETLNHRIDSINARCDLQWNARRHRLGKILHLAGRGGYQHFSGWKSAFRDLIRR